LCQGPIWCHFRRTIPLVRLLVVASGYSLWSCQKATRRVKKPLVISSSSHQGVAHRRVGLVIAYRGGSSSCRRVSICRDIVGGCSSPRQEKARVCYRKTLVALKSRASSCLLVRTPHIVESLGAICCFVGRAASSLVVALSCSSSRLGARNCISGLLGVESAEGQPVGLRGVALGCSSSSHRAILVVCVASRSQLLLAGLLVVASKGRSWLDRSSARCSGCSSVRQAARHR